MKTLFILPLLHLFGLLSTTFAEDTPLLGRLPDLGTEWTAGSTGAKEEGRYRYAWATFTNSKSGDIISFAANQYEASKNPSVRSDPTHASANDMFPQGRPRFSLPQEPDTSGWTQRELRYNIVKMGSSGKGSTEQEALEYSMIYEPREESAGKLLGHGYVLCFGATTIFVQHTSAHIITPDDAEALADSILKNHR